MLNLLVAAIISDYQEMQDDVDNQTMLFMAEYVIQVETYRNVMLKTPFSGLSKWLKTRSRVPDNMECCPHEVCNNQQNGYETNCQKIPIPQIRVNHHKFNSTTEAKKQKSLFIRLVSLRNRMQNDGEECCDYHKSMEREQALF